MLKASLYWIELLVAIEVREAQLVYQFTTPRMIAFSDVLEYRMKYGLEQTIDELDSWQVGEDSGRLHDGDYQLETIMSEGAEMINTANRLKEDRIATAAYYDLRKPGTLTTYLFGIEGEKEGILWHRLLRWYDQFYLRPRKREVLIDDLPPEEREKYLGNAYED